jgi:hypothetical protein
MIFFVYKKAMFLDRNWKCPAENYKKATSKNFNKLAHPYGYVLPKKRLASRHF